MARILIIEDDEGISDILRTRFERDGHRVGQALDGESGLAELSRFKPELVVLDLNLPGVDGFEVCRRIRTIEETRTLPVIMLTAAYPQEHRQTFGRMMGANEYLTKPVDWPVLREHVNRLLAAD